MFWRTLSPAERRARVERLNEKALRFLRDDWVWTVARGEQLAPSGGWRIWLFLGGRGAGKTRSGAEWVKEGVDAGTMHRVGLIGATHQDARAVMIDGVSGLLRTLPSAKYEPANQRVLFANGAVATVLSADQPDAIRGHQFDAIWGDEFAKWPDPQGALDMALMALRLGNDPRMLITTTPRAIDAVRNLVTAPDVAVTRSRTADNAGNLAPGFLATMEQRYQGSRLGRQELEAEIIEDNDAALWRRAWIDASRVRASESGNGNDRVRAAAPALEQVVVAVDPPASVAGECGIVVAGRAGTEGIAAAAHGYILADLSADGLTPNQWAARVAEAFAVHDADLVIAEANQGGDMVRSTLHHHAANLPVRLVHATRGKRTRAAPVSALYEQGRIHHVGTFPELEDQMCNHDGSGASPDRMDALVWALAHLFPAARRATPKVRAV
jgi:phage terminase large subunit-like protein